MSNLPERLCAAYACISANQIIFYDTSKVRDIAVQ
jgi:hypothetical protein